MASIKKLFFQNTQKKRQLSSASETSSTNSPPKKKVNDQSNSPITTTPQTDLKTISENMDFLGGYFDDPDMPKWAKHMYVKLCNIIDNQDETKRTLDSLVDGQRMFEERLEGVIGLSVEIDNHVESLKKQVVELEKKNYSLNNKLEELENYSKKYNVKIFNLPESQSEDTQVLMNKLSQIMFDMDLNIKDIYIDNIHRLPSAGKGPSPVIVKCVQH